MWTWCVGNFVCYVKHWPSSCGLLLSARVDSSFCCRCTECLRYRQWNGSLVDLKNRTISPSRYLFDAYINFASTVTLLLSSTQHQPQKMWTILAQTEIYKPHTEIPLEPNIWIVHPWTRMFKSDYKVSTDSSNRSHSSSSIMTTTKMQNQPQLTPLDTKLPLNIDLVW